MDDFHAGSGAPNLRSAHSPHLLRIVLLVAAIVALLVVSYMTLVARLSFAGPIATTWSALTLPSELHGAQFISVSPRGTVVYERTWYRYAEVAQVEGAARSITRTAKGFAAISTRASEGPRELSVNGTVIATSESLRSLAGSPDGRIIAYAETSDGSAYASDPAKWTVRAYFPDPGIMREIGSGFAPLFLDNETIARFTMLGLFAVDLPTGTPTRLLAEPFPFVIESAQLSPDHTLVAWQGSDGGVTVHRIGGEKLASYPLREEGMTGFALADQALYAVRVTSAGTEVWRFEFDGQKRRVTVLPTDLEITRLSFPAP